MDLLVFAFLKEAQSFIEYFDLKKTTNGSIAEYSDEKRFIIISGPGISNTKKNLEGLLKRENRQFSRIINAGIAGTVNTLAGLNCVYSVRKVCMENNNNPAIISSDSKAFIDCITIQKPAQGIAYAEKLQKKAHIVDMELWAVASVASKLELPYYSIKFISDEVRNPVPLNSIIKNAKVYSDALCTYYIDNF